MSKMYQYKGFSIEPIVGGLNIVLYGKKHTLYVAAPAGCSFTDDMRKARSFRSPEFCERVIDELVNDHDQWVKSLGGKPIVEMNLAALVAKVNREIDEQQKQLPSLNLTIQQQQQQQ